MLCFGYFVLGTKGGLQVIPLSYLFVLCHIYFVWVIFHITLSKGLIRCGILGGQALGHSALSMKWVWNLSTRFGRGWKSILLGKKNGKEEGSSIICSLMSYLENLSCTYLMCSSFPDLPCNLNSCDMI